MWNIEQFLMHKLQHTILIIEKTFRLRDRSPCSVQRRGLRGETWTVRKQKLHLRRCWQLLLLWPRAVTVSTLGSMNNFL